MGAALTAIREATAALEAQEWNRVRQLLAADFVFLNPYAFMPEMGMNDWLSISRMISRAFSDFTYNFKLLEEDGQHVGIATEFEGTFDHPLDLSMLDGDVILPTYKHARASRSLSVGTINDETELVSIEVVDQPAGAGMFGLLVKVGAFRG